MATVKTNVMDLLKAKANKTNDKFQRFQSELKRALKELSRSQSAAEKEQRMLKINKILSDFSFDMNMLESKYIDLCQSAFTKTETTISKSKPFIDDTDNASFGGSSDDYIDSEIENTRDNSNAADSHPKAHRTRRQQRPHSTSNPTNVRVSDQQKTTQSIFECNVCFKTFGTLKSLNGHRGGAHHMGKNKASPRAQASGAELQCEHCEWIANRRSDLFIHIRNVHNLPPFKCEISGCGATFHWNKDFREHQKTHFSRSNRTAPRPLHDSYQRIHRPLKRRRMMTNSSDHRWTPRNNRTTKGSSEEFEGRSPFQCSICWKQLSSRNELRNHMLLHGDKRPFACHLCPSAFVLNNRLTTHLMNVHNVMPYQCDLCKEAFARKRDWEQHRMHCTAVAQPAPVATKKTLEKDDDLVGNEVEGMTSEQMVEDPQMEQNSGMEDPVLNDHDALQQTHDSFSNGMSMDNNLVMNQEQCQIAAPLPTEKMIPIGDGVMDVDKKQCVQQPIVVAEHFVAEPSIPSLAPAMSIFNHRL